MLPKDSRLNLKFRRGKDSFRVVLTTEDLIIRHKKGSALKGGVTVSKAVAKKAVDRNRIKRTIMEALRLSSLSGEFTFLVKRNISDLKRQEIDGLLKKIGKKLNN